jgi:hypothetical protein
MHSTDRLVKTLAENSPVDELRHTIFPALAWHGMKHFCETT